MPTNINVGGSVLQVMDPLLATKVDKTTTSGYWYIGTPNNPNLLPSQTGWQIGKMDETTKDVELPRGGDNKATDDFVFTWDDRAGYTYGPTGV